MATFALTITAPPRAVFDYLVEPGNRPQWQASLRSVEVLDTGPVGVGTRWIDHTAVGARPRMRIDEFRPPGPGGTGVWREVGEWRGIGAELTLWFEEAHRPTSTLLRASVTLRSRTAWLPARLVLQALAPSAVRNDLRRAARILEAGSA